MTYIVFTYWGAFSVDMRIDRCAITMGRPAVNANRMTSDFPPRQNGASDSMRACSARGSFTAVGIRSLSTCFSSLIGAETNEAFTYVNTSFHLFFIYFYDPLDTLRPLVASVTRKWQKWMAVSCTHGHLADPRATRAMLAFRKSYAPSHVLHLGDFCDMAALRAGARRDADDPDRAQSMADDLLAGLSFLQELEPQTIHLGNHEDRLCGLAHSGNAVVSYAAGQVIGKIEDFAKKMKAKVVPYAGLRPEACTLLGDTLFLHGVIFSMSAARDHAETLGMSCCFGHTHRVAQEQGRTQRPVVGYNIGCGLDLNVGYAKTRRATLGWSHGFAFGEFNDQSCTVNLVTLSPHYRLPI